MFPRLTALLKFISKEDIEFSPIEMRRLRLFVLLVEENESYCPPPVLKYVGRGVISQYTNIITQWGIVM